MQRRSRIGLSRRGLLQSLGLGAAMGPLLPLLNASGQEAVRPLRLLIIFQPDGAPALNYNTVVDWMPKGTEKDFTLHAIQAPLEPIKSKLVVPWGMTLTAGGAGEAHAHGMAGLWTGATLHEPHAGADFDGGNGNRTGWGGGPSVDQIVAKAFGPNCPYAKGPTDAMQETPYRSVALGVQCGGPNSLNRMTYSGDKAPIHPEVSPKAAFDRLFAGVMPSTGGSGTPQTPTAEDPAKAQARTEQRALVDLIKGDLTRIRTRIGTEEYHKVDAHLEGLLAIERRIGTEGTPVVPVSASCSLPPAIAAGNANYPTQLKQMMDIIVHAFACDVTRVASFQMSYAFSHILHTWLGHTSDHHAMSHDGQDRRAQLQAIDAWYSTQLLYMLQKMDSIPEGTGTLLDNTLVVCGRELGSTAHRLERAPFWLAGKAGGKLVTQRFLNVDKQAHAKLLVSILQLMGVETNTIGNRVANSGPLPGLVA